MARTKSSTDIPLSKRHDILNHLFSISTENELPRGSFTSTAKKFGVSNSTVSRIWNKGAENKREGNCGRKTKWTDQLVISIIQGIGTEHRSSLRSLSKKSGIPKTILLRKLKKGLLVGKKGFVHHKKQGEEDHETLNVLAQI